MTATGRLFWIETRRSIGLLAFPVLAGLAWLAWFLQSGGRAAHQGITLWPQASVDIGFAVVFVGPAAGGLAAWVAGRDRRRGLGDLLATTPAPVTRRELTLLAATALWALLAYVAAGIYQGVITAREATWGGPVWPPIVIAGLAIAAQAAIGYAAGSFAGSPLTSRLMAGLVPIVLFVAQVWPTTIRGDDVMLGPMIGTSSYPYENLAPSSIVQDIGGTVYWSPRMDLVWAAAAWFGGLGALALAIMVLRRRRRSPVAWGTLVAAALAIVIGWTQLVPAQVFAVPPPSRAIAYEPVCTQRSIEICVHPAYESALDDTADIVDAVIRPLVGLPGFPVRAEQVRPDREGEAIVGPHELGPVPPDLLGIVPANPDTNDVIEASFVAVAAVAGQTDWFLSPLTPAQSAIAIWLMDQSGFDWSTAEGFLMPSFGDAVPIKEAVDSGSLAPEDVDGLLADVHRAADRFGALTPEEQRAWLEANFAALRAGELALEDLP